MAASSRAASRSSTSIGGAEVVAEGRGLGRLAVGIGDDQRVAFSASALSMQRVGQVQQPAPAGRSAALAQRHLEQRVVHVVARPRGVQRAAEIAEAAAQLGLDEEEVVLVLAGVGQRGDVGFRLDVAQRRGDGAASSRRQDAGLAPASPDARG